ncbi:MAG: hypothetical protein R2830_18745 [Saprospiraceae bacterium]
MKNLIILTALLLVSSVSLHAQCAPKAKRCSLKPVRTLAKGQIDLQVGYGLLTTAKLLDKATTLTPPISIRAARMMGKRFSLGAAYTYASHQSKPYVISDGMEQRLTNSTHAIFLRPAFHFTSLKNADLYGGIQVGVYLESFSVDNGDFDHWVNHKGLSPRQTKGVYTAFIGGRYFVSKRLSLFGEIGFTNALMTVGAGYRI